MDLAGSIHARLNFLLRTLDQMAVLWEGNVTNEAVDEVSAHLDNVLLRVWAVQDNLALLVGQWLEIKLPIESQWSLHDRRWRAAVRATGARGEAILAAIEGWRLTLAAAEELRHHAAHRVALASMRYESAEGVASSIHVPAPASRKLREGLTGSGNNPSDWGIGEEMSFGPITRVADHGGGPVEEYEDAGLSGAFLDPMPFAARLVACAFGLVSTAYQALAPQDDPRLAPEFRERALTPPTDEWATPAVAWQLTLVSPLSGLVPWADIRIRGAGE